MKKYIIITLLILIISPSVALASWWKPTTWKIFQKKQVEKQTEFVIQKTAEEKIDDLQKQLEDLKNRQQDTTKKPIDTIKPVVFKKNTEPVNIKINDVCFNIEGIQSKIPDGYKEESGVCNLLQKEDICINIEGIQDKLPEGFFIYTTPKVCLTLEEIHTIKENSTKQTKEQKCRYITEKIREKEEIMRQIEIKYRDIISEAEKNPDGKTSSALFSYINNIEKQRKLELEPVVFERDVVNQEYARACNY